MTAAAMAHITFPALLALVSALMHAMPAVLVKLTQP
jgi:hypothetical protein